MRLKLLLLIVGLQTAWLLATVVQQERALAVGQTIMLETERVDPRDLIRGDYLILNYKINTVPRNLFTPPLTNSLPAGTGVYVALVPGVNGFSQIARASTSELVPAESEILLRGKSVPPLRWNTMTNAIRIEYGLERYYVAEGTGNPTGKLTVRAIVPASHRARIQEVFVEGKPYADAMKP